MQSDGLFYYLAATRDNSKSICASKNQVKEAWLQVPWSRHRSLWFEASRIHKGSSHAGKTPSLMLIWFLSSSLVPTNHALLFFRVSLAEMSANKCNIWESWYAHLLIQLLGSGLYIALNIAFNFWYWEWCPVHLAVHTHLLICEVDR